MKEGVKPRSLPIAFEGLIVLSAVQPGRFPNICVPILAPETPDIYIHQAAVVHVLMMFAARWLAKLGTSSIMDIIARNDSCAK